VLDFDEVLARGDSKPSLDQDEEEDPDRPIFSLLTGKYRHAKRYGGELQHYIILSYPFLSRNTTAENHPVPAPPPPSSSALVLRDQDSTIATLKDTAAGVHFFLLFVRPTREAEPSSRERRIFAITYVPWPRNTRRA
jgi:diphthamide biosynthesis protein 2